MKIQQNKQKNKGKRKERKKGIESKIVRSRITSLEGENLKKNGKSYSFFRIACTSASNKNKNKEKELNLWFCFVFVHFSQQRGKLTHRNAKIRKNKK